MDLKRRPMPNETTKHMVELIHNSWIPLKYTYLYKTYRFKNTTHLFKPPFSRIPVFGHGFTPT